MSLAEVALPVPEPGIGHRLDPLTVWKLVWNRKTSPLFGSPELRVWTRLRQEEQERKEEAARAAEAARKAPEPEAALPPDEGPSRGPEAI